MQIRNLHVMLMLMFAAMPAHAGWLDKLKDGVDTISKGVDTARDVLEERNGGKKTQPEKASPVQQKPTPQNRHVTQPGKPVEYSSPWPLLEIKSPDPATIRPLKLESFRGEIILGRLPPPQGSANYSYNHFHDEMKLYRFLLAMNEKSAHLDRGRLKAGFLGGNIPASLKYASMNQFDTKLINELHWFRMLTMLAQNTMTDAAFKKYFCPPSGDCVLPSQAAATRKNISGSWGGLDVRNTNEFHAKRVFNEFVDNELDKYFAMAKQTRKVAYFVRAVTLQKYEFNKGGYRVNIFPGSSEFVMSKLSGNIPVSDRTYRERGGALRKKWQYYMISEDRAPAFAEKVKQNDGKLYYYYKIDNFTAYIDPRTQSNDYNVMSAEFIYDPLVISHVDVFFDRGFTDKAFTLSQ